MIKIFNGTQHAINFYRKEDTTAIQDGRKLVVNEGAVPFKVIAGGTNLNAVKGNAPAPDIESDVPLVGGVIFTGHDVLPEGYDIYVVSNLFRAAVKELGGDTSKLATVDGAVYSDAEATRPCGCLQLAVG